MPTYSYKHVYCILLYVSILFHEKYMYEPLQMHINKIYFGQKMIMIHTCTCYKSLRSGGNVHVMLCLVWLLRGFFLIISFKMSEKLLRGQVLTRRWLKGEPKNRWKVYIEFFWWLRIIILFKMQRMCEYFDFIYVC